MGNSFNPDTDIPDLAGKVYVVTGGSAGIGFGIVAHILQHKPERVYLLSNKEEHAAEAMQELASWGDIGAVKWIQTDLADLKATNEVAQGLKERLTRLDGLVLNAGLGVGKYWETTDGLDSHFQVNFLSQMLLSMVILPVLLKTSMSDLSSSPRLVMMSSDLHRGALSSTKFASKAEINTDIGPMRLYNRSKLAQILFIRRLAKDLELGKHGPGRIQVIATHPGGVKTDQQQQAVEAYGTLGKIGVMAVSPFMKDPVKAGCRTALFAATSDDVAKKNITGAYVVPDRKVTEPSSQAQDEDLASNLWRLSEGVLKEKFGGKLPYKAWMSKGMQE